MRDRCGLPKADQILPGSARPVVGRRQQGALVWPVPAAEAQDSSGPRGPAGRCVTSRAMPRGRDQCRPSSLFPRLENLSGAERNLRVRLSENATVMHVHHG
jgi:hypothetical protein